MFRKVLAAGMMISGLLALTTPLRAAPRVIVRPYGYYSIRPYYRPFWGYGEPVRVYVPAALTGELKIDTKDKDALVYVDGGYLGTTKKFRKFDLRPGNHAIELRDARGDVLFHQKVEIAPDRTTEIDAMGVIG
jgi:hypothetical protein